ncbi:MAG: hypothetical protein KDK96_11395 [Chlamydiia bacterium]|nr:hypothetical protein [Chlamydiia bacterium]MCB9093269.1 hypothetical protein [Halobacteriovoraceae bacterium]
MCTPSSRKANVDFIEETPQSVTPFPPSRDEMRNKVLEILKKTTPVDSKSLVGRALKGTPAEDPFSFSETQKK